MIEGKTRAIIAHLTLIGWIVAIVQNNSNKKEFASFYIRQVLGLFFILMIGSFVSRFTFIGLIVGALVQLGAVILWVMSIVGAFNGRKEVIPVVGPMFQSWFRGM